MLPTVLPGSTLHVLPANGETLAVGDIVCYPTTTGVVVAHRVVSNSGSNGTAVLMIRGDAQAIEESVPRSAMSYVVRRVEHPLLSYDTESRLGRFFSTMALRHHALTLRVASTMTGPIRLVSAIRSLGCKGLL